MNETWKALEGHRGKVAQIDENSTRAARFTARYTTTGLGVVTEQNVFAFDMAFLDMPTFNYGGALGDGLDLPDATADYPTYQAGVYRWKINGDGYYTGAWCWFSVTAGSSVDPSTFAMDFLLSWSGIGSKNFIASPGFPVNALEL